MSVLASSRFALRSFARDDHGAVALMFGITLIPLVLFAGAAIDYARGAREKVVIANAIDATGLAVAQDARRLTQTQLAAKAQAYFEAAYRGEGGVEQPVLQVTLADKSMSLSASSSVPTTLMRLAGHETMAVSANATVAFGTQKIEVVLALDNTGSMRGAKLTALQAAAHDFVNQLAAKATAPGEVKVSLVPFNTQVRLDPVAIGLAPANGPVNPTSPQASRIDFMTYGVDPVVWTANACLTDRDLGYDADPRPGALYPARLCAAGLQPMAGLADLKDASKKGAIDAAIDGMTASGNTNLTIGLSWAQYALTPGNPLAAATASQPGVKKFIVLLTDGDNTQNRFTGNANLIDARTRLACDAAKAMPNTTLYTIRVIDGNIPLLRACATSPDKYFEAADASQIQPVFQAILNSILSVRLAS